MKKKHLWWKILLIVLALILIGLPVGFGFAIHDDTNNTPDYISEVDGKTPGDILGAKAEEAFDEMDETGEFSWLFNEHELNDILATVVPMISIPLVTISSIYLSIDESDNISVEAPVSCLFYQSCLKANAFLSYDSQLITLTLKEAKLGTLSNNQPLFKMILNDANLKSITSAINDAGVYLDIFRDENTIYATMSVEQILKTIIAVTNRSAVGLLSSALVGGLINNKRVTVVLNENGLTGIVINTKLLG